MADDLERWEKGEPIVARPIGRMERVGKLVRRNPAVAGLASVGTFSRLGHVADDPASGPRFAEMTEVTIWSSFTLSRKPRNAHSNGPLGMAELAGE